MTAKLAAGRLDRELPINLNFLLLPLAHKGLDLGRQFLLCRKAAMQALFGQGGKLNLDHVQPTAGLGREVKLKTLGESKGFRRRERFIQRTEVVRVQIILY